MGKENYFIGFDFGTESVRGAVFDQNGVLRYEKYVEYPTYFPAPGWAEQKPDEWWESFIVVARDIVKNSGLDCRYFNGITIDTTSCSVVFLDKDFTPLRNAIIWMDVRSHSQAERIARAKSDILRYNGFGSVSAEWMPCKALWVKENEPDLYKNTKYVCEFQDYINYRLTGKYVGSINNTTVRWYYDPRNGGWPVDFYREIGLSEVIDKFPERILPLGSEIGKLSSDVSKETGLPSGIPILQGGADAYIAMVGLGAIKPGKLAFITGSSHLMLGHTDKGFFQKGIFGAFPDCVMPGYFVVEGAQISTGSVLKWFKDQFVSKDIETSARKDGSTLYDYMSKKAEKIDIGSEGLIVLNYWQGNRNPLVDSKARGVILGLSLKHTPFHIYRAIMEGVSYGTEHIMRYFKKAGFEPEEIIACGGATKSTLWMQIQSDVLGLPILLTEESNAPLLGDAILAAVGSGFYSSIDDAVERMVRIKEKIVPDLKNTEKYKFYVEKYIATYPALKDIMHEIVDYEHKKNKK